MDLNLSSPAAALTAFFATAALMGFIGDAIVRIAWRALDRRRVWVITVPTTPGAMARIDRVALKRGEFSKKEPTQKDEQELFIARGDATYPTNRGPMHLMSEYGANLVAPTKEQAIAAGEDVPQAPMSELGAPPRRPRLDANGEEDETDQRLRRHAEQWAKVYHRFRVWDPLTYWRATRENDMEDLYAAQREKDHWAVKLAPVAILLFVGILGFLGFILWKIYPLLQHAATR